MGNGNQIENFTYSSKVRASMNKTRLDTTIKLTRTGRISIGRGAELLGVSIQDMQRLADKHGIKLGPTIEQHKKSIETLKKLGK